jgi:hypothetical protein
VAGLAIALSWAATTQRSDVRDVVANNKPGDDDTEPSNEFELELSREMSLSRGKVHEADGVERTVPEPKRDHIQYIDYPGIRLMLDRAKHEEQRARDISIKSSYREILHQLFGTGEKSQRQLDREGEEAHRDLKERTAATEQELFRKRKRERELER